MPQPRRPATDRATGEIIAIYRQARERLEQLVRAALERGATGTAAFYQQQLQIVLGYLSQLQDTVIPHAARTVAAAYSLGADAADAAMGRPAIAFAGVHQQAIDVIAANLAAKLNDAAVTVGRRTDDAFRRASLQQIAIGIAAGEPRRAVSAQLQRKLVEDGVTDALTGFVDARGRRWGLDTYTEMAARTTTREAVSAGTANRLLEAGRELVTITRHSGACEICIPFEGNTYALTLEAAERRGYPMLEQRPPFHPNCRHVMTPAAADFEAFGQLLEENRINVPQIGAQAPTPPRPGPPTPPPGTGGFEEPPFGRQAAPQRGPDTTQRLAAQRQAWELDPGPELEDAAARNAHLDTELAALEQAEKRAARSAKAKEKAELDAIKAELGPDVVAALEEYGRSGISWARDRDLYEAIRDGDTSIEDVTEMAERELAEQEGRRSHRLELEHARGFRKSRIPCFSCGRFKSRPSDVCDYCGDDPVTWGGDANEFDAAYGFAPQLGRSQERSSSTRGRGTLGP